MLIVQLEPVKEIRKPYTTYTTYGKGSKHKGVSNNGAVFEDRTKSGAYAYLPQAEYEKRKAIIAKLYLECPYKSVGTTIRPVNEQAFEEEGFYRLNFVMKDWLEYKGSEKDETKVPWPESDNPLIVQATCLKTGKVINATTNYFRLPGPKDNK